VKKIIKAILWDFDGTLLNSTPESMENMIWVAKQLGLEIPTIELLQKYWGILWFEFIKIIAHDCYWEDGSVNQFANKCRENKERWRNHQFFEGTEETLDILISQGVKNGIISTRIKDSAGGDLFSITDYFKLLGVDPNVFFFIQGREDCPYVKPNPRVFDLVLAKLKEQDIAPDEVVYVGDTMHDFWAAKNYVPSLSFIAITSGACNADQFLLAKVSQECIINSPQGIFEAIKFLEN